MERLLLCVECSVQWQGDRKGMWAIWTQDGHKNLKICDKSVEGHQQKIHRVELWELHCDVQLYFCQRVI